MYNIILLLKSVACFSISLLVLFLCHTLGAYVSTPRVEQKGTPDVIGGHGRRGGFNNYIDES